LAPGVPSLQGKTLFHGTYGKAFDEFKGRGGTTWLSEAADHASEYARGGRRSIRGVKPGARIHPVKADVTNPLDITDVELGGNATLADIAKKTGVSEDDLAARIRKYAEQDPNFQNDLKAGLIPSKTGIGFAGPIKGVGPGWNENMQWFRWFDHKPVTMALRDLGFDGVQAVEHYGKERKAAMTLGVFDSPKIKSIWDVK
jgi:hypothetical protein